MIAATLFFSFLFCFFFSILGTIYLSKAHTDIERLRSSSQNFAWSRFWYFWALISGGAFLVALFNTR